jgi:hypothetical protein
MNINDATEQAYKNGYEKGYSDGKNSINNWISVEDGLPNIDQCGTGRYGGQRSIRVLCACKQRGGRTFVKEGYYELRSNGNIAWRIPGSIDSVTHWMSLPNVPKESK